MQPSNHLIQDRPRSGHHRHGLMHVLMFIGTFFWAANIIAGKFALRNMSSLALAQARVTGAGVIFLAGFALWRRRVSLRLNRRDAGYLVLVAFFGIALNQLFFIGGIGKTSAAHAGLIVALGPVIVLILSCGMQLEALTAFKLAGAVISLVGVAELTTAKPPPGTPATLLGDAIMFVGTAVFAYYTILLKKIARRYDGLTLNTIIFVIGAVLMLPVTGRDVAATRWTGLPAEAWWGIAFMVTLGSVVAYSIYAFALTELSASRVAAFNYLQPVIAAALGVWLLGETLTVHVLAGGFMILLGVYLTEYEKRLPETRPDKAEI